MATTLELCESIELRLQQVLDETDRLTRALDALGPGSSVDGRAPRGAAPAVADTPTPLRLRPTESPPHRPMGPRSLQQHAEASVPVVERAVRELRAELDAGLRTTVGV